MPNQKQAIVIFNVLELGAAKTQEYYAALEEFACSSHSYQSYVPYELWATSPRVQRNLMEMVNSMRAKDEVKIDATSDLYRDILEFFHSDQCKIISSSNNQRSLSEVFEYKNEKYELTFFESDMELHRIVL